MIDSFLSFIVSLTRSFRYKIETVLFQFSSNSAGLESLHDIYSGRPIVVVGNGPSLNNTPMDLFQGYPSIGMNKINLLFSTTSWRPNFIITSNNIVAKQHYREFLGLDIPVILAWKCRHFMPRRFRDSFLFFNTSLDDIFSCRFDDFAGSSATVTYSALQLAYYLGASSIILLGIDHSFNSDSKNIKYEKMKGPDPNHFSANYFKDGQLWGIPNLTASEASYRKAYEFLSNNNIPIYDATVGGKLDVFPKISLAKALEVLDCNS